MAERNLHVLGIVSRWFPPVISEIVLLYTCVCFACEHTRQRLAKQPFLKFIAKKDARTHTLFVVHHGDKVKVSYSDGVCRQQHIMTMERLAYHIIHSWNLQLLMDGKPMDLGQNIWHNTRVYFPVRMDNPYRVMGKELKLLCAPKPQSRRERRDRRKKTRARSPRATKKSDSASDV